MFFHGIISFKVTLFTKLRKGFEKESEMGYFLYNFTTYDKADCQIKA